MLALSGEDKEKLGQNHEQLLNSLQWLLAFLLYALIIAIMPTNLDFSFLMKLLSLVHYSQAKHKDICLHLRNIMVLAH